VSNSVEVETIYGKLSGILLEGAHVFRGIRYAASPVHEARFRPPMPPPSWAGVQKATEYGPMAPQGWAGDRSKTAPSNLAALYAAGRPSPREMSEDCLVLDVSTPGLDDERRPVMVWFHGGAFISGSGATDSAARLAATRDVVVVSLNHRLGVAGFLYLDELSLDRYANSGLLGMLDMVAALEWVRDNISSFGGDPSNITIFGCSGGGLKVSTLLAMPSAAGLFHKAIIESGPYIRGVTADQASEFTDRVLRELELASGMLDELHRAPIGRLLDVQIKVLGDLQAESADDWAMWSLGPVVGGSGLPHHPFEPTSSPLAADVPLIIGLNSDEGSMFLLQRYGSDAEVTVAELHALAKEFHGDRAGNLLDLYARTRPKEPVTVLVEALRANDMMWIDSVRIAERKASGGPASVFMYRFAFQSDVLDGRYRAGHGMEVPFVFNDVQSAPLAGTRPERFEVAEIMSEAWVTFAKGGDPNHSRLPKWAPYTPGDRSTMIFDAPCFVEPDPTELREGLNTLGIRFNP
jgi:para-nitrobenzyl esterase